METRGIIYGLFDPAEPDQIRYVGQTRSQSRLYGHIKEAKNGRDQTYKGRWVRKVLNEGRCIEMRVLASCSSLAELNAQEILYIETLKASGHRLTNSTIGGEGIVGHTMTPETRAKLSAAKKGRPCGPFTAQHRANLSASLKGKKRGREVPPEERARISAFFKGRKQSEAHRAKRAAAQSGKKCGPLSAEHRAKLSVAHSGRAKSDETRARISAALRRRWATPSGRAKYMLAHHGVTEAV